LLALLTFSILTLYPFGHVRFDFLTHAQSIAEDFFYSYPGKIYVTIGLDRLGVAVRDNVTSIDLQQLASRYNLTLVGEYPQAIFIYSLPTIQSRQEIVRLARNIARQEPKVVAYSGFTATPNGTQVPFIVTDEFIAKFRPNVTGEQSASFNKEEGVTIVSQDPFVENQFLLKVTDASPLDALDMANLYHESDLTDFSHPNFVRVVDFRQFIPNDPLFGNQWHHRNTGQAGGTPDADVDTPEAWTFTQGAAGTIIAVIDNGFDMTHPDLAPNLWVNGGEIAANGIDDDLNGFVDDVNGYDFKGNDGDPGPGGPGDNHGTAVAGVGAARGDNAVGVAGSCLTCSLMLIRSGHTVSDDSRAFGYAQQMGAQIITNSWGYSIGTPTTTAVENAINNAAIRGRGGLGIVIFFAMNNRNVNDCPPTNPNPDISSLPNVIAVSRSTNRDQFDFSGFGNCMDVLAPTAGRNTVTAGRGTLWITTTDRQGVAGYNNDDTSPACPSAQPAPPPPNARDYTLCFTGTSSATPLVAGIAGLILSVDPGLTRLQVQQLLQDTADKIEDSAAGYAPNTGFSAPATGEATHGWGRVNAFEAVRVAAPVATGGRSGVDIFLRDNRLDWGNTEQPSNTLFEPTRGYIPHWESVDIKVDAPSYQPAPTAATFDGLLDETPSAVPGDINHVYVRLRNRGRVTASSVTVKLHWAQFGSALPALPSDFWARFPADSSDTSQWHPLNCAETTSSTCTIANLAYSGASVAGTAADAAQIVAFDFPAPPIGPGPSDHFCLLATMDSPQDPISPQSRETFVVDTITPGDNNVAHRNYVSLETSRSRNFTEDFYVRNPTNGTIQTVLRLGAPQGWQVGLEQVAFDQAFIMEPNQQVLVKMNVVLPGLYQEGEVVIVQGRLDGANFIVMGGVTYQFVAHPTGKRTISMAVDFSPRIVDIRTAPPGTSTIFVKLSEPVAGRTIFMAYSGPRITNGTDYSLGSASGPWTTIGTATTDERGEASLEWTPTWPGDYYFMAYFPGDDEYAEASATSEPMTLTVIPEFPTQMIPWMLSTTLVAAMTVLKLRERKKVRLVQRQEKKVRI